MWVIAYRMELVRLEARMVQNKQAHHILMEYLKGR